MRHQFLAALLLTTLAAVRPAEAAFTNQSCLVCHTSPLFDADKFRTSVHWKLSCADCHEGYDFSAHRAKPPEVPAEQEAQITALTRGSAAPAAFLACGKCHASQKDDWLASVHGRWLKEKRPIDGPTCTSCHGHPHAIPQPKTQTANERHRASADRCATCHDDPAYVKAIKAGHGSASGTPAHGEASAGGHGEAKAGGSGDAKAEGHGGHETSGPTLGSVGRQQMETHDPIHGRLVALGSDKAAVCFNCHGSHEVAAVASEESLVSQKNRAQTCGECHKGATPNFASVFNHHHPDSVTRPIPFYTDRMFSVLTTLSLLGLFLHVVLDLGAELRVLFTRKEHHFHAHGRPNGEKVVRFDIHQLIQHWSLMSSVILLTLSGWPIRAAEIGPSAAMISVFGGLENARFIHRVMGAVLCLAAAYHLIYLTVKILQRKLALSMLPMPRDAVDMLNNMLYFVGVKKERPKFAVFSYAEKFDYWAVFWGVAIMGGTGFIRWFPVWFGKWLPGDLIAAAQIAHGEEATLAALALFVWHLYNVHLRPSIFPMSWIWIDGKISIEALAEEHAEEYEKLVAEKKLPGAPAAGGTPPAGGKP